MIVHVFSGHFTDVCVDSHVSEQQLFFCSFSGLKHKHEEEPCEQRAAHSATFRTLSHSSEQQEDFILNKTQTCS